MPTQDLNDASVFLWSRERELVPVYDRLLSVASTTECLEEIKELCDIQQEKLSDCTALLAAVGIEPPGNYMSLDTEGDLDALLPLIWSRENEVLDQGWLRVDRLIDDEAARAILLRGSRRHSRQMQLIREIARKCNITLVIVNDRPGLCPVPGPFTRRLRRRRWAPLNISCSRAIRCGPSPKGSASRSTPSSGLTRRYGTQTSSTWGSPQDPRSRFRDARTLPDSRRRWSSLRSADGRHD